MNWGDIQQALETYLDDLNTGLEIAWENVTYFSTPGTPFIRVVHVPVDTVPLTVGSHGVMDTEGIMVLGLNYPSGAGSGAALAMADTLASAFVPGTSITAGGGNIVVLKTMLEKKQPSSQPDWWVLPVLVHYNAFHSY